MWLDWVRRLQAIAQNGLQYTSPPFERERWELVQKLAAEMAAREGEEAEPLAAAFAAEYGHATPKVDVRGVVFRDDRVLLVRGIDDRQWTLPGGWAEVGERPSEAVEKEVREESGYEVRAAKLLAVHDRDLRERPRWPVHRYKLFFLCKLVREEPGEPSPHETDGVGWFSEADVRRLQDGTATAKDRGPCGAFSEDDAPGLSERVGAKGLAWVFEHLRDLRPVQPEVAAAAAALGGEEAAVDEPRKVPARGRGSDASLGGEGARRQRAAVAERREHPCPSRLGEQGSDGRQVRVSVHEREASASSVRSGPKRRRA